MYFLLFLFINICTTFTTYASSLPSLPSDDNSKSLSDAEIAILGLSPPTDPKQQTLTDSIAALPVLKPQESLTSSFITYDESDEQPIASDKPFTITFPISRNSRSKQSVQSIVIPLPSHLDDKTGIIVIEDHDDGGSLDRRTLRAQFFSPTRIKPFRSQPLREENIRNETEISVNRISGSNRRSQSSNNRNLKKSTTTETKAEPSTTSSVVFDDDDVLPLTSTFSPEAVFRPKSTQTTNHKKQNSTTSSKPIVESVTISLKARQRVSKKSKAVPKSSPKTTTTSTTTTTTTTTTEPPTTTEEEEDFEDIENTESTTFTTPETTTRTNFLRQFVSINDRPNVRRKWIQIPITTTQRPTTTSTERTTTLRTTTQKTSTERPTTQRRRTVPQRRTPQRRRPPTTTTTTTSPTITTSRWDTTTTSSPPEVTELDYEFISLENSSKTDFDRNSLKLIKPKNRTTPSVDNEIILKPRPPGPPHIPGNFGAGFLPSGKAFNLPHNVPGSAGIDYPTYDRIPVTTFDCKEQTYPGFYADLETGCQVYHSCNGNLRASKHTFLCPNGTIFSQEYLICDWWYNVQCRDSPLYYPLNKEAFSSTIKTNATQSRSKKKTKPKTTTTEFVIRTITTTDLP